MNETVSIIMPCYNGGKYISESINSVLAQNYTDFELLVIDDYSDDESSSIINIFCTEDTRVKYIVNNGERGAANARNLGIFNSRGRYIAFLDCDDVWIPDKLSKSLKFMDVNKLAFMWSSYSIIDEYGNYIRQQRAGLRSDYFSFLLKSEIIGCLTVIYDSFKLGKVYSPIIKLRNDYALWVSVFNACDRYGHKYMGCSENLALLRSHSKSLSSNKLRAAYYQWIFYRKIAALGRVRSFLFMIMYLKNGVADRITKST